MSGVRSRAGARRRAFEHWPLLAALGLGALLAALPAAATQSRAFSAIATGTFDEATWLFAADASNGMVSLARVVPQGAGPVTGLRPYLRLGKPTALAFRDGWLYACDAEPASLVAIEVRSGGKRRLLVRGAPLHRPVAMAISPEGRIAIAEPELRAIVWADGDGKVAPVVQSLPEGIVPEQLAFAAGQLLVLDAGTRAVFQVPYAPESAGASRLALDPAPGRLDAIVVDAEVLYLTGAGRLAVAAKAEMGLTAAGSTPLAGEGVRMTTSSHSLFFTGPGSGEVLQAPRPIPVAIRLDVDREVANRALAQIYDYALQRNLVDLRKVEVRSPIALSDVLVQVRVLVGSPGWDPFAPSPAFAVPDGADAREARENAAALRGVLCKLNSSSLCRQLERRDPLGLQLPEGSHLVVPALEIRSVVRRSLRELSGATAVELLPDLVFDPVLRARVGSPAYLSWINRGAKSADMLAMREGRVFLPAEAWVVTVVVLASDLDGESPLRSQLRSLSPQIFVLSKETFARGESSSAFMPGDGEEAGARGCAELRAEREKLFAAIHYPGPGGPPAELSSPIGILEYDDRTDRGHVAFTGEGNRSAWVRLNAEVLEDDPAPEPFLQSEATDVRVLEAAVDRKAWHGSHVAGIVGGRDACGGGLLPKARLFRIQPGSAEDVGNGFLEADKARVRVINVSQKFPKEGRWGDVLGIIRNSPPILFIAAAGEPDVENTEARLEDETTAPYPVAWAGMREAPANLLVVTASDWSNDVLPATLADGTRGPYRGQAFIDLAAPGLEVYSSTTRNEFEPKTGTSQAAPQVTAAAAQLFESACGEPPFVRARLIATAEWLPSLQGEVWGGLLDYGAAVFQPQADTFTIHSLPDVFSMTMFDDQVIGLPPGTQGYSRSGGPALVRKIPFRNIVSLRQVAEPDAANGARFRVVYLENDSRRLHVILDTTLQPKGNLTCTAKRWDPDSSRFVAIDPNKDPCRGGSREALSLEQIKTFFRRCGAFAGVKF